MVSVALLVTLPALSAAARGLRPVDVARAPTSASHAGTCRSVSDAAAPLSASAACGRSWVGRALCSGRSAAHMAAPSGEDAVVRPFIIGIGGGSASGKTTVVESIMERMACEAVVSISQDCFYRGLTPEQIAHVADYNFDAPAAMDWDMQVQTLRALQQGAPEVRVPQYDFCTHSRLPADEDTRIRVPEIVIFEGILALHDPRLRDMFDLSIFVDTDSDLRLLRRISRDMESRGRSLAGIMEQYERFVKPSHDQFIEPCKKFADLVVPFNRRNLVAIELICDHINLLRRRCAKLTEDFHDLAHVRALAAGSAAAAADTIITAQNGRVIPTINGKTQQQPWLSA